VIRVLYNQFGLYQDAAAWAVGAKKVKVKMQMEKMVQGSTLYKTNSFMRYSLNSGDSQVANSKAMSLWAYVPPYLPALDLTPTAFFAILREIKVFLTSNDGSVKMSSSSAELVFYLKPLNPWRDRSKKEYSSKNGS
jgi:hypothetical protein